MEPIPQASAIQVKAALDKMVDSGIIALSQGGHYVAALPDLGNANVRIPLRNLTLKYGKLEGMEAVALAVIPPALLSQVLDVDGATAIVNAALAAMPPKGRKDVLGF